MAKNLLGQGQIQSHQDNRPDYRMEAQNILADELKIGGPVFGKMAAFIRITQSRQVV